MRTYGVYVWSSYGLTLLILLWVGVGARRSWLRELKSARRRVQVTQAQESEA